MRCEAPFRDRFREHLERKIRCIEQNMARDDLKEGTYARLERMVEKLRELLGKV